MEKNQDLPKVVLRISLALVFLYFGFQQVLSPDNWTSYIPEFLTSVIITANNLVVLNGIVELTLGTFLLIGLYTNLSSLILGLHLLGITLSIGLNAVGVRDFGLTIATFVIFLNGPDKYCLDNKFKQK